MIAAGNQDDPEDAPAEADDILCEILTALGFEEIVAAFNKVPNITHNKKTANISCFLFSKNQGL